MTLDIEMIRREELQVSNWAGGTTTQLAIFPKDAVYSERNFKWRLSSAKVEVEESTFTSLPNIKRVIMIIDGELVLDHDGHHKSVLRPFDQDRFSGNWKTKSFGKVTDFNLMMNDRCEGELEAIHLEKEQTYSTFFVKKDGLSQNTQAIFCVNGQVKIKNVAEHGMMLYAGDMILVTSHHGLEEQKLEIYNAVEHKIDLIKASIWY